MSPSEEQLRAALRDGQPDGAGGLDVDAVIGAAVQLRHRRMVRYGSALGAVAAATTAGVLVAALSGSTHSNSTALDRSGGTPAAASEQAGAGAAAGAGGTAPQAEDKANGAYSEAAAACPPSAPNRDRIGTGAGSFFTGTVALFTLCSYAETGGGPVTSSPGVPLRTVVSGADAAQLARSLDGAATAKSAGACPLFRSADAKILAMIPTGTNGAAMAPITTVVLDNPCNQPVTNGSVVRYNWQPASAVASYLQKLAVLAATPGIVPQPASSSPLEHGSPINS